MKDIILYWIYRSFQSFYIGGVLAVGIDMMDKKCREFYSSTFLTAGFITLITMTIYYFLPQNMYIELKLLITIIIDLLLYFIANFTIFALPIWCSIKSKNIFTQIILCILIWSAINIVTGFLLDCSKPDLSRAQLPTYKSFIYEKIKSLL